MAFAAGSPTGDAKLRRLDVSAGRWIYHGHFLGGARPSPWIWHEDCHWSANRVFMLCSFSNTWAGRHVDSEVVDTYDAPGNTFWHYEIYPSGDSAGNPFAAKMQIEGATRTESWTQTRESKSVEQRIVYKFVSAAKVTVMFQRSEDGTHWTTTAVGTGEKIG
ncbi:MAG TPA: hypothetical protein VGG63_15900 [Steroidobacteraceae bacterium]